MQVSFCKSYTQQLMQVLLAHQIRKKNCVCDIQQMADSPNCLMLCFVKLFYTLMRRSNTHLRSENHTVINKHFELSAFYHYRPVSEMYSKVIDLVTKLSYQCFKCDVLWWTTFETWHKWITVFSGFYPGKRRLFLCNAML